MYRNLYIKKLNQINLTDTILKQSKYIHLECLNVSYCKVTDIKHLKNLKILKADLTSIINQDNINELDLIELYVSGRVSIKKYINSFNYPSIVE